MRPWQPGDLVGQGRVYLPDRQTRDAYMRECERQKAVPGWVRHVLAGTTREQRRQRLSECPEDMRDDVRARVEQRWRE